MRKLCRWAAAVAVLGVMAMNGAEAAAYSQPVSQPAAQSRNRLTSESHKAVAARQQALQEHVKQVMATRADFAEEQQFQQQLAAVGEQGKSEVKELVKRYNPQLKKDPNNAQLRSQFDAELDAARLRNCDRMEQFLSEVEAGKLVMRRQQGKI